MSGHSKWSQIKRQKGVADTRRGQLFTKLAREIMVAVRAGGADPEGNFRLRLAMQKARENNMPVENIDRAIKRASGGGEGGGLEEAIYEGYTPGGAAILIETVTDNRNRTVAAVRNVFTRGGGNLAETGSVSWLFEQRGVLVVEANQKSSEELALLAIDTGADDVKVEGSSVEIYTSPHDLEKVKRALEAQQVAVSSAEVSMVPKATVPLDEKSAWQSLKLMDRLEELDEVQRVVTNADFPNEVVEQYRAESQ